MDKSKRHVQDVRQSQILYFPHIEIPNTACLKSALCVWDTVLRIVPQGYTPHDSDEIKMAVDSGALRNLSLSQADLEQARDAYHGLIQSVRYLPDALDRMPEDHVQVHQSKIDERMVDELTDLIGGITRNGDWLQLPRGLADGYMLYLADTVSRRRQLGKFTDSDTMFVSMQYFDFAGNFDEKMIPDVEDDFAAALILETIVPEGIEDADMKSILRFRNASSEGRAAFRSAVTNLARDLAGVEEEEYLRDLALKYTTDLEWSRVTTWAQIREHFSDAESLMLYLGVPLAAKAFEIATDIKHGMISLGALGIVGIAAFADVAKSRRRDWVPLEATYYCRLKEEFGTRNPIPRHTLSRPLGVMMDEFMND